MKFLVIVLSLLTIFLSSYPCCQETVSCSNTTTVNHCDDDGSEEQSEGDSTPCSPFYACGRCPGFTMNFETLDFAALELPKETHPIPHYIELLPKEVYFFSLKPPRTLEE